MKVLRPPKAKSSITLHLLLFPFPSIPIRNPAMPSPPLGLRWRASTLFIIATVAVGIFTDLFLYGLIVPVLPFLLRERISLPQEEVQSSSSALLAAYAAASVCFSLPAGWIADRTSSRRRRCCWRSGRASRCSLWREFCRV